MSKPLILVVEDDVPVRNLITITLKTHGYRYLTAGTGDGAVIETSSHNPDVVLLDLGLPDMDGVDVIRKIRTWSNLPIIVISARSEDTDKIDALDAGADDYLTKPFSVEELLARLRVVERRMALMNDEAQIAESVYTNGRLRIDFAAGCAYPYVFSRIWCTHYQKRKERTAVCHRCRPFLYLLLPGLVWEIW